MRVYLQTSWEFPTKGDRVRLCRLTYIVTAAEEPTDLDGQTFITECDVQPCDGGSRGPQIINAKLVPTKETADHE